MRSAGNASGFEGVREHPSGIKPFFAQIYRGGRNKSLGNFGGAAEAALARARVLGSEAPA